MCEAYLLIGSNLGDIGWNLRNAMERMSAEEIKITDRSSVYKTEPWGFNHDSDFLNQVIRIETSLKPLELLEKIQKIERDMGRNKNSASYSARIIDIDILFYGDRIIETDRLTIPHPKIHERMFVLAPMAEIAPDFIHPVLRKPINRLKDECDDRKRIKKLQ
jgi:2-amino-4-hydroxy-6-hydroxymethyldihydropteridine diphosphokinase